MRSEPMIEKPVVNRGRPELTHLFLEVSDPAVSGPVPQKGCEGLEL
jgi:hypothetical protein